MFPVSIAIFLVKATISHRNPNNCLSHLLLLDPTTLPTHRDMESSFSNLHQIKAPPKASLHTYNHLTVVVIAYNALTPAITSLELIFSAALRPHYYPSNKP